MDRVRIGSVKYLNTLPLVEGLAANRDLEVISAVPAKLGAMLAEGAVDVALASIVDFATSPVPLCMLPVGGIGCDGPTLTVRMFSQVPLERVETLHADTDSHTSVLLARVLLARCFGRDVRVVDFDARERVSVGESSASAKPPHPARKAEPPSPAEPGEGGEWPRTLLLIGDKVVTDSPPAVRYPHQLDLGEQWKAWTGLPFLYAVWMCRAADVDELRIRTTAALLDRQRLRNVQRTSWLIDRAVDDRRWPRDLAVRYVTDYLRYEVGPRQREAVARFLTECAALNLLPTVEPRWAGVAAGEPAL
ncbi:MAG: MqnA/MqnD/SBP family protein [Phycisphaerales bacterium]|nr:MqnA/MqnD/SBP family protein [Phycisphaerales bacterium]